MMVGVGWEVRGEREGKRRGEEERGGRKIKGKEEENKGEGGGK
jgi:hypothetical protein